MTGSEWTMEEFLAHAVALEQEAVERYAELADQMASVSNTDVSALFGRLSEIEALHLEKMERMARNIDLPVISPWAYRWADESPEAVPYDDVHYLMTPHHALRAALEAELAAREFFADVAESAGDAEVQCLAEELRNEEAEHVQLIEQWLARFPPPERGWDDDLDPPIALA